MVFEPVNELERLLMAAAADPAARPEFYRAILEEELLIITEGRKSEPQGWHELPQGSKVQIRAIEIEGQLHTPIFSSVERISAVVPAEVGFMAMKGRDLLVMLRGKRLVLNPGADYGKIFTEQEVASMLDGSKFSPGVKQDFGGEKILLGQPSEYPKHLTEPLGRLFAKFPEVKAAYLAHAMISKEGEVPHTLIGLDMNGDWKRVTDEVGIVLREVSKPGEMVDLTKLKHGSDETISEYLLKHTKPFYMKKKWLGLF